MKKIKIFLVITGLYPGGAERQLERTVLGLDKKKFDVTVLSIYGKGGVGESLEKEGVKVKYLNPDVTPSGLGMKTLLATFTAHTRLRRLIKKEKPDIIHAYLPHASLIARFAARRTDAKVISSIRVKELRFSWHNTLDRWTRGMVDMYTTNSYDVKRFVQERIGVPEDKIKVIYNGINIKKFTKKRDTSALRKELAPGKKKIITMVAAFREQKDHNTLLEAAKILKDKRKDLLFLLVGADGPTRDDVEQSIEDMELTGEVMVLTERDDVPAILQLTDVSMLTTNYEGSPNTVIEAMISKVPVIVTDLPETREIVTDKKEGLLVPPKEAKKLAGDIEKLLTEATLRKKLVSAAYKKACELFDIKKTVKKTEQLYLKLMKASGK